MIDEEDAWPSVLCTGSSGVIGSLLAARWRGRLTPFDLPDCDARDQDKLTQAARGHDAIVHLAWDGVTENARNEGFAPQNLVMAVNAVEAATRAGVRRVVLASSVHADTFWPPSTVRLSPARRPVPDSPYGASKVFVEAIGRYAAAHHELEAVAIRFGGVNSSDRPPQEPIERAVWLPHADCLTLLQAAATAPLPNERFALVIGVGESAFRVHEFSDDLRWRPRGALGQE